MHRRILIFGNSGSGKSTLAKKLCSSYGLAHLDLDSVAWEQRHEEPDAPPERAALADSRTAIEEFTTAHDQWVVEGCYTDLLDVLRDQATEAIFLDPPMDLVVANAESRPWEPHKYESKAEQDANLPMLIDWIQQYYQRNDTFSHRSHLAFYEGFPRQKWVLRSNSREELFSTERDGSHLRDLSGPV